MTNAQDRAIIARAYRRKLRIVIVTRALVYHCYVIGYRGKYVSLSDTPGGGLRSSLTYGSIQYAGIATNEGDERLSARWSTRNAYVFPSMIEELDLCVPHIGPRSFRLNEGNGERGSYIAWARG